MESYTHFEVGDLPGRYRAGFSAPGTEGDLKARQKEGYDMFVLRLRFCGVYLPDFLLKHRPVVHGMLNTLKSPDGSDHVLHVERERPMKLLGQALEQAVVWKEHDNGSLLLRGVEWDEGELQQWPQTWLCCNEAKGVANALKVLAPWLEKQYARVKRPPYPSVPLR
ncbi:MAG: hypothetical protein RSF42_18570 [Comamonas sp.]